MNLLDASITDQTVLIVEDDEINREAAQGLLAQLGFRKVHTASNGRQGIRKVKELPQLDVVLVDIYMPVMDGIEFVSELARLRFQGKVIMVSGVSLETLALGKQLAQESGINVVATMEKPLHKDSLLDAMC